MKIKALKKTATIQLETKAEVQAFALAVEYYMTMVYQDADPTVKKHDSHYDCDDLMLKIDKKFNKQTEE
jgi:hypothetical protein